MTHVLKQHPRIQAYRWSLRLAVFLDAVLLSGMIPLVPWLTERFQVGANTVELILDVYGLAILVVSLPAGLLSDRFGSGGSSHCGRGVVGHRGCFDSFIADAVRFFRRTGCTGYWRGSDMDQWVGNRQHPRGRRGRGRELGLLMASSGVGASIGPPLSGLAVQFWAPSLFLWLAAALLIVNTNLLLWQSPRKLEHQPVEASGESPKRGLRVLFIGAAFLVLGVTGVGLLRLWSPLYLSEEFQLSELLIGQVFFGAQLFQIATRYAGEYLSDTLCRRMPLI